MPINKGIPGGAPSARKQALQTYRLDDQVGFLLRQAYQRNVARFSQAIEKFTVTQWAALAKLHELGECSQNSLGRATAMDTATIRGVVSRLKEKGFVELHEYPDDRRRVLIRLTDGGRAAYDANVDGAVTVSARTVGHLSAQERRTLTELLRKLLVEGEVEKSATLVSCQAQRVGPSDATT